MTASTPWTRLARALAAAATACAALAPHVAHAAQPAPELADVRVTLGWTPNAGQLPFLYGAEKGYFKDEGLNVTIDSGSGAGVAVQRVVTGAYQFGYADLGTVIRYDAENRARPVTAVYVGEDEAPLALFTLQSSGIHKPKDIEGKRIGVSQFDGARLMLPVLARANGIDLSKVETKTVDAQLRETLLVRGEVDVITGFTSTSVPLLTALHQQFRVLRYGDFGVLGIGQAVVVTADFAARHPNTVRAFVRAFNRALKAMIENPADALAVLKQRNPLADPQAEARRFRLVVDDLVLTPNVARNGLSSIAPARLAAAIQDVLGTTRDASPLASEVVYDPRFLPDAAQRRAPVAKP